MSVTDKQIYESPKGKTPKRYRLPDERRSKTHKFVLHGNDDMEYKGYLIVGLYDDGTPGEMFIYSMKSGSMISGLLDTIAIELSIALQYGIPLDVFVDKFVHTRFEPQGMTDNPQIRIAKSLVDYIFRWLTNEFLDKKEGIENDES